MEAKAVDVSRGIAWFSGGWRIFMKNPGLWIVLGIIVLAITVVLSIIPILGIFALSLVMPVLVAGLLYAAREADAGRALDVLHVFQGFRDKEKLTPLLSLGGLALAGLLASFALAFLLAGGSMVTMMLSGERPQMAAGAMGGFMLAGLVILVVELLVATAIVYAIPLVMFRGTPTGAAMRSSFNASLRNFLPLLVFGVVYLFAAIVAMLPLMLGWLVLLPASAGMLYLSYKDLYEPA